MLDIKFIRENADLVKTAIANKNEKADIDLILQTDEQKRKVQFDFETLKAEQNKTSKEIAELKKNVGTQFTASKEAQDLLTAMSKIASDIKELSAELTKLTDQLDGLLLTVPNIPHDSVPIGKSEADNMVTKSFGDPKLTNQLKEHQDIAADHSLLDFTRGAKITGSGFPVFTDRGAILERALINFMLDFHITRHGYTEVKVPFIVNRKTMIGTGQLPKLENDMYHLPAEDYFLIPTAEVPVTNLFSDEILHFDKLPTKYICYSPCFRREAGSYGKDTKGLQRLHQFNKVEMVRFVHPEFSWQTLEEMLQNAEAILQALDLPYRVLTLCTGDMSFASAKTYDLEVWSPATQKYLEVSSVSNFVDFQARRANIRYRDTDGKVKFVHTLNGSGLATPRTYIAILENYQQPDGSIVIPEVLRPYTLGMEIIS